MTLLLGLSSFQRHPFLVVWVVVDFYMLSSTYVLSLFLVSESARLELSPTHDDNDTLIQTTSKYTIIVGTF